MMTTAKAFGITRPGDHLGTSQYQQNSPAEQQSASQVEAQKFSILSEALKKFMNNEITQEQLKTVQDSLK
jgi:hypothetical protein